MKVKIRKIGNSLGIILPKDILELMRIKEGDEIDLDISNKEIELKLKK